MARKKTPIERTLRAVRLGGPEVMSFCGRSWQRDVAQPITPDLWAAMKARGADRLGFTLIKES